MDKKPKDIFAEWGKRIDWKKRVKAVCKPCWEIKYCPYGPLVEEFPLREERDSRSCRIFGHDCPVFHVAEPITETKELRNISRSIPRPVQFRVLKRENQICSVCGNPVQDGDIHFDHIIPFSKGGSSDESNIRLLCDRCNQSRSDRYEAEYLVSSFHEHTQEHSDLSLLDFLLMIAAFVHEHRSHIGMLPSAQDIADQFHDGDVTLFETTLADTFSELHQFFKAKAPEEMTVRQKRALAYRWGYQDCAVHLISDASKTFREDIGALVMMERALLSRAGWHIKEDKHTRRKWETK
jgi:hypothetical protein